MFMFTLNSKYILVDTGSDCEMKLYEAPRLSPQLYRDMVH